jgi:CMP-N,N'-diacetyllegionaminic acid synthase
MKVLAIIPARAGSKTLKRKNIKTLLDKPLIIWTLDAAKKSKFINEIVISTDSEEIQKIVNEYGFECNSLRPSELALDTTTSYEVINYEISRKNGFDIVCMLQPTSPIRDSSDLDMAFDSFLSNNATSCVSVYKIQDIPYWTFKLSQTGFLSPLFSKEYFSKRRQELDDVYALNGAIYISKIKDYLINKSFVTDKTLPFEMTIERSIDIDTIDDFEAAEKYFILNNK